MDFTQQQKYEILAEELKKEDGLERVIKTTFEILMKAEQREYLEEHTDYRNGYRYRKIIGYGKIFELKVPRVRNGTFMPMILGVLKSEEEECRKLAFGLYSEGLTTEQVSRIYGKVYGREYSTSQISRMFNYAREEVKMWQSRTLEAYYPILYIDATFVMVRRDGECRKEAFYTILALKDDGRREVLAVVNSPVESSTIWRNIFQGLKERGMERTSLVVSDGLRGIDDIVSEAWSSAKMQLCTVHLMRDCTAQVRKTDKAALTSELKQVLRAGEYGRTSQKAYEEWQSLCERWGKAYPTFKRRQNDSRYRLYFTFLDYHPVIQSMIYTTNWIERLNRSYKRVLKMRAAMPDVDSVILLMSNISMNMTVYERRITKFFEDTKNFEWDEYDVQKRRLCEW